MVRLVERSRAFHDSGSDFLHSNKNRLRRRLFRRHNLLTLDASPTFPPKPPPLVDLSAVLETALFFCAVGAFSGRCHDMDHRAAPPSEGNVAMHDLWPYRCSHYGQSRGCPGVRRLERTVVPAFHERMSAWALRASGHAPCRGGLGTRPPRSLRVQGQRSAALARRSEVRCLAIPDRRFRRMHALLPIVIVVPAGRPAFFSVARESRCCAVC